MWACSNLFATIIWGCLVTVSEACCVIWICQLKFPSDGSSESSSSGKQPLEVFSPLFPVSKPFKRILIETGRVLIKDEEIKYRWNCSHSLFPSPWSPTHLSAIPPASPVSAPLSWPFSKNGDLRECLDGEGNSDTFMPVYTLILDAGTYKAVVLLL